VGAILDLFLCTKVAIFGVMYEQFNSYES